MDVHALLRRVRAGESNHAIARAMHLSRNTIKKYRDWFVAENLVTGPLVDLAELHQRLQDTFGDGNPPQNHSSIEAYRSEIQRLFEQGLRPRLIFQKLSERAAFTASESAVYRLCRTLKAAQPPEVVVRLETPPGEVAQVDFGEIGKLFDPVTQTLRRAYCFVMLLAWSRHMFVEFVFDQTIPTWLCCHQHAFEFFDGVPQRVVLDNLKAAIVLAYTRDHDPEVTRAYAECAEHYDFLIDPCLPRRPEHKGKVERGGVGYVQQSFVPLLEPATPLPEANRRVQQWLLGRAGLRTHGTTQEVPLARFAQTEQKMLLPLPRTAFDPAEWKQVKLHRDGHVVFQKAFYSAPYRFVGQRLWLRAGLREIRLFSNDFELLTTHSRAARAGARVTHLDHLPPEKVQGLTSTRESCRAQAAQIGPATAQVITELLDARPVDKFRTALRVLHLADTYTPVRLEAACVRGLAFGDVQLVTLKHILVERLDELVLPATVVSPPREMFVFVRPPEEFAARVGGSATWK